MENTHERVIAAPAAEVGRLIDRLGSADDPLWPSPTWVPMRFDRPLGVGADGGHGPVRYRVTGYEPGRRLELTFDPRLGLDGTHSFEVTEIDQGHCLLRHHMSARLFRRMPMLWPLIIEVCHDTVLEHLLDNAVRATGGTVEQPVRYPWRARLVVALAGRR